MNATAAQLRARYAAISRRERGLTIAAVLALVLGIGHLLLIEPALRQRTLLQHQASAQQAEREALKQSMSTGQDTNATLRTQLATLQTQLRSVDREFAEIDNGLVKPQQMGALLQSLLTQHRGLQLLGLRSLPVKPIGDAAAGITTKKAEAGAERAAAAAAASAPLRTPAADEAWLYRHGVEIRVQGSYADMLAYLQALERLPRHVHWGDLELDSRAFPASVLTVTIFTVSPERSWWVL